MLVIKSLKELRSNFNYLQPNDRIYFNIQGFQCCGIIVEGFQYCSIHECNIDGVLGVSIGNRTPFEKLSVDDHRHRIASLFIHNREKARDWNTNGDWPAVHQLGRGPIEETRRHLLVDLASLIYIGCDMYSKNKQGDFHKLAVALTMKDAAIYDRAYNTFLNYGMLKPTFGEQ